MMPKITDKLLKKARFFLLEENDIILKGDTYYNNFQNKWLPVEKEFIGCEFRFDESKPIRRKNPDYKK